MRRVVQALVVSVLCLAGVGVSVLLFGPPQIGATWRTANDFIGFYTAGKLAFSPDLYDVPAFMHAQGVATGWISDQLLFVRLPWQAVLFAPLTVLPFPAAHTVWTAVCLLAIGFFLACWPAVPVRARMLVICWSIPAFVAIDIGQDIPLVLAALGLGFRLLAGNRPFAAGLCLSLAIAKPHLLWPLALIFLFHKMWRVCLGGAMGVATLLAVSFLSAGFHWIPRAAEVIRYADLHARLQLMPTLHSALLTVAHRSVIEIAVTLLLLSCLAVCLVSRGITWKHSAALALVVGVVLGRHAFLADCVLLLPALFLTWPSPRFRMVLCALASPAACVPAVLGHLPALVFAFTAGALFLALDLALDTQPLGAWSGLSPLTGKPAQPVLVTDR